MRYVFEGELTPSDKEIKDYHYLPFEVPPHTHRINVTYTYSDPLGAEPSSKGGNILDIGIFDSRGIAFLSGGFRGWSGVSHSRFFISEQEATPGYLPGQLLPGQWHIILGLHEIASYGCHYIVEVEL
ncbi:MAG: hypothetical protein M1136_11495 [Chloroflexi bacterium]|nr:hypothetical protein [Chloroflexota bacterium]MCL5076247.1 hypothetical protein [Chloroflexota bacterium]